MRSKSAFLLTAFFCLFMLVPPPADAIPFLKKNEDKNNQKAQSTAWILSCSVNNFKLKELDAQHYPVASASNLALSLQDLEPSQKCCKLENELATESEIMSKLDTGWLAQNVHNQDRVFIIFSLPCFPSEKKKEVFLLPYDTDPKDLDKSAIRLEQILDLVTKIRAKNVVVIIETPFAGSVEAIGADDFWFGTYNLVVDEKLAAKIEKMKNMTLIISSKDNQPTTSGAFFKIFAQELRNLPNAISLSSLFERVKIKTMESTKSNCSVCKGQIPVLYGKFAARSIILGPSCLIPSSSK